MHSGQVAHQAGALLRFLWRETTRSIFTSPGWDASPLQGYASIKFAGTHYTPGWGEAQ